MKKMGAPRKEIDYLQLEKLVQLQCTELEICGFFGITEDTLNTRVKEKYKITFSEYYKNTSQFGKISLRRSMFKTATDGNCTMQIWLSKQMLGMRDGHDGGTGEAVPVQVNITMRKDEDAAKPN